MSNYNCNLTKDVAIVDYQISFIHLNGVRGRWRHVSSKATVSKCIWILIIETK